MGLAEVLTIVFIVLKLIGVIHWSWWLVLLPEILAIGLYMFYFGFIAFVLNVAGKKLLKKVNTMGKLTDKQRDYYQSTIDRYAIAIVKCINEGKTCSNQILMTMCSISASYAFSLHPELRDLRSRIKSWFNNLRGK